VNEIKRMEQLPIEDGLTVEVVDTDRNGEDCENLQRLEEEEQHLQQMINDM
jgi:hypothetical protein